MSTCQTFFTLPLSLPQFFEMLSRFLAEGAASGLNVFSLYVTDILRVTGVDGGCQFVFSWREGENAFCIESHLFWIYRGKIRMYFHHTTGNQNIFPFRPSDQYL